MLTTLILAGGESKRMGFPKLTLLYKGKSLLEHAVLKAKTLSSEVLVVVGAYPEAYTPLAKKAGATVVINPDWQEGLGTTLRTGIKVLKESCTGALVLLADQPFVSTAHLQDLIETQQETSADLVFSSYVDLAYSTNKPVQGPPIYIAASLFEAAKLLKSNCGAKALIGEHTKVSSVSLVEHQDIDTPEDALKFLDN